MRNSKTRGFTLIELLVVIAIIGILSSVVLASLNTARTKGKDGAVKANLTNVRSEMELYYFENENYGIASDDSDCDTPPFNEGTIGNALASVSENGGTGMLCLVGLDSWAISVVLPSGGGWCVSSIGISGPGEAQGGGEDLATCVQE